MLSLRQKPAYVTIYGMVRPRLIYFSVTIYPSKLGCPINVHFGYSAGDFWKRMQKSACDWHAHKHFFLLKKTWLTF